MCKVYNPVGSLTSIKQELKRHKIEGFNSVKELLAFQDSYPIERQKITSKLEAELTHQKNKLSADVLKFENEITAEKQALDERLRSEIEKLQQALYAIPEIEKSYIQEFTYSFKALFILIRIKYKKYFFNSIVSRAFKEKLITLELMKARLQHMVSNFNEELKRNCGYALYELDKKKKVIDELKSTIYGAFGEQKVAKVLEQLSDEYILINDFSHYFERAIYHKPNQYIRTIQVDHLLISPAGIFLIETKNWSWDSVNNLSLRSPVEQIKRTNYALYRLLSNDMARLKLDRHHWGERRIPIRNLIVMINRKPKEKFEHVTILTLNELLAYVGSCKPSLSQRDIQKISDHLMQVGTPNFGLYSS